jgi:hypothetical protein
VRPRSGLARLMSRINLRISGGILGLPPRRLDFQRQNSRNPARCQRTTVSGRTMDSASTMPGTRRYSPTKTNRSKVPKTNLFREVRRSTLICCRRTRISASSLTLERNKLISADHQQHENIDHWVSASPDSPPLAKRIGFPTRTRCRGCARRSRCCRMSGCFAALAVAVGTADFR